MEREAGSWGGLIPDNFTEKWHFQKPIHDFAFPEVFKGAKPPSDVKLRRFVS